MPFEPHRAAIRFGTGLSPVHEPPASVEAMLQALAGPDAAAQAIPIPPYAEATPTIPAMQALSRARRGEAAGRAAAEAGLADLRAEARDARVAWARATIARQVAAEDALRERLTAFWADHFTSRGRGFGTHLASPFVEEAVRPHVGASFGTMLTAVTTHPMMLLYLDQVRSLGPNSPAGRNGGGLNENLARELMELHTLGAGGPYGQADVRELAELLTGLGVDAEGRASYRPRRAEPGSETVLGVAYPAEASLGTVAQALADLALHPATAAHVARKMAVHFVADEPDAGLVAAMADAFAATGGDLLAVTAAMLGHPAAWAPQKAKVKPPVEFVASSLRALGVAADAILAMDRREAVRTLLNPLGVMGQPWQEPPGPDGWPEGPGDWVTPQFMAARIDWAMNRPEEFVDLPDPRDFALTALGPAASAEVLYAANAAERPSEGVGVILASSDFQRR